MSQEKRTKFNPELAATILVESLFFGDQKAVARYGINDKTLIGEARTIPLYGKTSKNEFQPLKRTVPGNAQTDVGH